MRRSEELHPSPHFSPDSYCGSQCTARVRAFSICSFDVPQVRLLSHILRERRPARRLAPLATKSGEKYGLGCPLTNVGFGPEQGDAGGQERAYEEDDDHGTPLAEGISEHLVESEEVEEERGKTD